MVFSHPQIVERQDRPDQNSEAMPPRKALFREPANHGQVRPAA